MMLPKEQQLELRNLVDALCEDVLTREQADRLEELAFTHDEVCQYYLSYLNLHGLLFLDNAGEQPLDARRLVRQAARAVPAPPPPGRSSTLGFLSSTLQPCLDYVSHRMPLLTIAAAVAMGSLVTMLVAWVVVPYWRGAPTPAPARAPARVLVRAPVQVPELDHVARLTRGVNCKWADDGAAPTPGTFLARGQRTELVEGLAEIIFLSGTRVVLQGPATFELESENSARLSVGRLVAKVCPGAIGFAIQTPVARVVDLGTEFGLLVEEAGPIEVHCFGGAVEVEKRVLSRAAPQIQRLCEGEARRVDAAGAVVIKPDGRLFVRTLPSAQPEPLVKDALVCWGTGSFSERYHYNYGASPAFTINADRYQETNTNTYTERRYHGFLQFDLSNLSSEDILAVRLSLLSCHSYDWSVPGYVKIGLYKVTQSWVEGTQTGQWEQGTVTYNNQPSHDPTPVATITVPTTITEAQEAAGGVWHVWDSKAPGNAGLADLVRDWVSGTTPNYGLMVRLIHPNDTTRRPLHRYRSSDHDWSGESFNPHPRFEVNQ